MANNLKQRPWIIDTAGAGALKASGTFVSGFVFTGYTVATHKAVIRDSRGADIVVLRGNDNLSPVEVSWETSQWIRGLAVTTLDSGQVAISIE